MNEIALIFHRIGIDTGEVLAAASTKWNFLPFKPGLVGGHCIGVDPYYLAHKAESLGYYPDIILSGRRVNDSMAKFIADLAVKHLIALGTPIKHCRVAVLGLSFKENCVDIRNSRVFDLINELRTYHVDVLLHDPVVAQKRSLEEYDLKLVDWDDIQDVDAIILCVAHQFYLDCDVNVLKEKLKHRGLIMDVKGILPPEAFKDTGVTLWRL